MHRFITDIINMTILRNLLLVTVMGAILLTGSFQDALATLTQQVRCRDTKYNATAWCFEIATCTPGDTNSFVFMWVWAGLLCPNGTPMVRNESAIDGRIGDTGMVGTARATILESGRILGFAVSFQRCDGGGGENEAEFPEACDGGVYDPNWPPYICALPDECGGGGGGGGDYYGGGYGGHDGGCSYCRHNWMWDAQCHDANDRVCPMIVY